MSMKKVIVSPIPNEWLDFGGYEDIDVPYAKFNDSSETLSETAGVDMIEQVEKDVENGRYQWETEESENSVQKVTDDEPVHFLKEAQKSARLLYDPNAIVDSFEDPSVSSLGSNSSESVDSFHAEAAGFGMKQLPTSSLPYKVIIFRGKESLMKLPGAPATPTPSTTSEKSGPVDDNLYEKGAIDPGSIRVVGVAHDDINSYVTSTTKSATGSPPPTPPPSPLNSPPRARSTVERGDDLRHDDRAPTHRSSPSSSPSPREISGCFGCLMAHLAMMVDCALLVSLCISSSLILAAALLFVLHAV
uniref:Uncharacterized protein n=1 Tax=Amphora coffeiformis TaxID=265554 RepID=A0A7S3P8D3_9STRA